MNRRLPIADWPARDRKLWSKAVEPGRLFGGGGAGAHWSAASRVVVACGYNHWLSWLAAQEVLDPNMRPADRVTPERVEAYINDVLAKLAPYSVLTRVQGLHDAIRVMEPKSDWKWIAQLRQSLKARARPARDKFTRLKQPEELVALGERLMDEAEAASEGSAKRRAVRYRDGLLIAFLAYRPVRRRNLAMMRLGRHLVKVGGCWRIVFAAEETKTRLPYEAVLPAALEPRLEHYLDVHRPVLLRGDPADGNSDAVWISEDGIQLTYEAVAFQIVFRTRREFGRSLSPHIFRDCAATSVAIDNPTHIGDASLILGHAKHETTEKFYNHGRSLEASRRHATMLVSLRESLKGNENR
jgi:integrase/recombinase XerD